MTISFPALKVLSEHYSIINSDLPSAIQFSVVQLFNCCLHVIIAGKLDNSLISVCLHTVAIPYELPFKSKNEKTTPQKYYLPCGRQHMLHHQLAS